VDYELGAGRPKYQTLKDINIDILEAAIRYEVEHRKHRTAATV